MKRRTFLGTALTVPAVCLLVSRGDWPRERESNLRDGPVPVFGVCDQRCESGIALARTFSSIGAMAFEANQDIGALWYSGLGDRIVQQRALLAGLAAHAEFELLCSIAREAGMPCLLEAHLTSELRMQVMWLLGPPGTRAREKVRRFFGQALAEEALEIPAELRSAFITYARAGGGSTHVILRHEQSCLVKSDALHILQG